MAILKDQIDRNILSYIDDNVVASKKSSYIADLIETFTNINSIQRWVSSQVTRDKILDCLISTKG
jgi:hypothetical protein